MSMGTVRRVCQHVSTIRQIATFSHGAAGGLMAHRHRRSWGPQPGTIGRRLGYKKFSMRVVGSSEAEALLEYWCKGLRSVLLSSSLPQPLDCAVITAQLRELRSKSAATAESGNMEPFWSSLYLAVALESELLLASQPGAPQTVAIELGKLATACANEGLLHFADATLVHQWINEVLYPAQSPPPFPAPVEPGTPAAVTPWSLISTPSIRQSATIAAAQLKSEGHAVIDNFLGPIRAQTVQSHFRAFVGECAEASPPVLRPGELDATGRSQPAVRGDLITWLTGGELAPEWNSVGTLAQIMRTKFLSELIASMKGPQQAGVQLIHPRNFMGMTMLSIYSASSVGFATHTDRNETAVDGDLRKISAVYYLNPGWRPEDGGELLIRPGTSNEVIVQPELDRLVLFWSDSVEHKVGATASSAPPRLALSFWFHEDKQGIAGRGEALSPLLQAFEDVGLAR